MNSNDTVLTTTTTTTTNNDDTGYNFKSGIHALEWDDATWILTSSFIIFTMQTGFGLIEAGAVNSKNEVNIMVKNAVDVIFGGITYWAFGFGLTFGVDKGTNPFCGVGYWFVDSKDPKLMGQIYSTFIFQLSFATTATTIVSGAMAERTHLKSYIVFSLLNTVVYCIPAHWVWAKNGFLHTLGVIDIAGSGTVHMLGAGSALIAAWKLGPRLGRYDNGIEPIQIGNGTNTLIGMFMLWWGWLAFNSGSTFGISGGKWILAARTAVITLNSSMGGGVVGIIYTYIKNKGQFLVPDLCNAILGSLVSVTASCALIQPWEAVVIGAIGGLCSCAAPTLLDWLHIDDPVCAVAIHGFGGFWGMIAAGLFVDIDTIEHMGGDSRGVFHGGGFRLLGIQMLACVCIMSWSVTLTLILLCIIDKVLGLRLSPAEEEMGSDYVEHRIGLPPLEVQLSSSTVRELLAHHMGVQRNGSTSFGGRRKLSLTSSSFRVNQEKHSHKKENGLSENHLNHTDLSTITETNGIYDHNHKFTRRHSRPNYEHLNGVTVENGVINPVFDDREMTYL